MILSQEARFFAGLMLITIPTIEFGGYFLLSRLRKQSGYTENGVQGHYFRAGHAHAGVLLILALVAQILIDGTNFAPLLGLVLRGGIALPPILMPVGFFLGAPGADGKIKPLFRLIYVGALSLAISAVVIGIGLLASVLSSAPLPL